MGRVQCTPPGGRRPPCRGGAGKRRGDPRGRRGGGGGGGGGRGRGHGRGGPRPQRRAWRGLCRERGWEGMGGCREVTSGDGIRASKQAAYVQTRRAREKERERTKERKKERKRRGSRHSTSQLACWGRHPEAGQDGHPHLAPHARRSLKAPPLPSSSPDRGRRLQQQEGREAVGEASHQGWALAGGGRCGRPRERDPHRGSGQGCQAACDPRGGAGGGERDICCHEAVLQEALLAFAFAFALAFARVVAGRERDGGGGGAGGVSSGAVAFVIHLGCGSQGGCERVEEGAQLRCEGEGEGMGWGARRHIVHGE